MIVSLVQCRVYADKDRNLMTARQAFEKAKQGKADLLVFPEIFMHAVHGLSNADRWRIAESLEGPFVRTMSQWAQESGIWTVFGIFERPLTADSAHRVHNTVAIIDHHGTLVDSYRKTHLYDAFGVRESEVFLPGEKLPQPITTPFGRIGVAVCYELRFPEVARHLALQGIHLMVIPAAWYSGPWKEHQWLTLLTARAVENTIYTAGVNQVGPPFTGGSVVVDPMGIAVAQASEDEAFLSVELDLGRISRVREQLPCIKQTRPELYLNR